MSEDIAHMGPMLIPAWLMAGWVAEAVSRAGSYGFVRDLGLGFTGSVIVGVTTWAAVSGRVGTTFLIACWRRGARDHRSARSVWRAVRSGP